MKRHNRADGSRRQPPADRDNIQAIIDTATSGICKCPTGGVPFITPQVTAKFGSHLLAGRWLFSLPSSVTLAMAAEGYTITTAHQILEPAGLVSGLPWGGGTVNLFQGPTITRAVSGYTSDTYVLCAVEHPDEGLIAWLELVAGTGNGNAPDEAYWVWFCSHPVAPNPHSKNDMFPFYGTNGTKTGDGFLDMPAHCVVCLLNYSPGSTWNLDCTTRDFDLPIDVAATHSGSADSTPTMSLPIYCDSDAATPVTRYAAPGALDTAIETFLASGLWATHNSGTDWDFNGPTSRGSVTITHYADAFLTTNSQNSTLTIEAIPAGIAFPGTLAAACTQVGDAKVTAGTGFDLSLAYGFRLKYSSGRRFCDVNLTARSSTLGSIHVDADESNWTWGDMTLSSSATAMTNSYAAQSLTSRLRGI